MVLLICLSQGEIRFFVNGKRTGTTSAYKSGIGGLSPYPAPFDQEFYM
jgi:hypothetical protein